MHNPYYPALAERLGTVFWTVDKRLVWAVREAMPWVRLLD